MEICVCNVQDENIYSNRLLNNNTDNSLSSKFRDKLSISNLTHIYQSIYFNLFISIILFKPVHIAQSVWICSYLSIDFNLFISIILFQPVYIYSQIIIDIYHKTKDTQQYPKNWIESILYIQECKICTMVTYKNHCQIHQEKLCVNLHQRRYPTALIYRGFNWTKKNAMF